MTRELRQLLVIVVRKNVLMSFIDENDLSEVHDVTSIIPEILKILLII